MVIQRSLNKADHCRCSSDGRKKIKLKAEAISDNLFDVTHSESGAEGSKNVKRLKSPQQTLASETMYPTALLSVFFLQPEKGKSV
jgi:hypothetical protein